MPAGSPPKIRLPRRTARIAVESDARGGCLARQATFSAATIANHTRCQTQVAAKSHVSGCESALSPPAPPVLLRRRPTARAREKHPFLAGRDLRSRLHPFTCHFFGPSALTCSEQSEPCTTSLTFTHRHTHMAPPKSSRTAGDDHKPDSASGTKEKGSGNHHPTSAKMRRGASQNSVSQTKESATVAPTSAPARNLSETQVPTVNPPPQLPDTPAIQIAWRPRC